MNRIVLPVLTALLVATLLIPVALRWRINSAKELPSSAELRLVVMTPDNQDIRREFSRAFDQWHREKFGTGVEIDYRTPGGTTDIVRQLNSVYDAYRGKTTGHLLPNVPADIDMVLGGGDFFFDQLASADLLEPMKFDRRFLDQVFPSPTLAGVRLYDTSVDAEGNPTPKWVGACLSGFGIIYNPQLYQALQIAPPRTWEDLTNPRLNGFIGLADPSHSGSAGAAFMMVIQRAMADAESDAFLEHPRLGKMSATQRAADPVYQAALARGWKRGMRNLTLICANARYFSDSSETVPTDVARGEVAAGMAIDFYAHTTESIVGPTRAQFVLPENATAITPDPVAILTGVTGDHLVLARQFVEFMLSREGQLLWALPVGAPGGPAVRALFRPPIRRDLYVDRRGWEQLGDPFLEAGKFNQRKQWMALFTDSQLIWVTAWIDSRDLLKRAYSAALAEPNESRRAARIEDLANLPVEMSDVTAMMAKRKSLPKPQLDFWRAQERIKWEKIFRAHYQRLEQEP